jgi:two-component system sensor histidine kinase BarA
MKFKTPLNGVIGFTDLLVKKSNMGIWYMSTVNESATILIQTGNDILDFSKVEAGKLALKSQIQISMS